MARSKGFDIRFDPDIPAERLRIGDRKILEILKVLDEKQKLLVLDEPTASFTTEETRRLLAILAELKALGTAILYVTHRLEEIEGMVDRVTVLRNGSKVGELTRSEANHERVVSLMVGRDIGQMYPHSASPTSEVFFSAERLRRAGAFEDVTLNVNRGEILALVGLAGQGSVEVARSVAGLYPSDSGEIRMDGKPIRMRSLRDALANGIAFLAEDRADTILRVRTVRENLALGALKTWSRMGFVDTLRAVWDTGDAAAPLDPRLPRAARDALLAALRPSRVVASDGEHHFVPGGLPVEEGDALVVATSGSSGTVPARNGPSASGMRSYPSDCVQSSSASWNRPSFMSA